MADEDLPALYRASLAVVFPLLYDGFGMLALEAMACDASALTSKNSSLPEVAGDAALLVDLHDAGASETEMVHLARDDIARLSARSAVHGGSLR